MRSDPGTPGSLTEFREPVGPLKTMKIQTVFLRGRRSEELFWQNPMNRWIWILKNMFVGSQHECIVTIGAGFNMSCFFCVVLR